MGHFYCLKKFSYTTHLFLQPNIHPLFVATIVAIGGTAFQHVWVATVLLVPLCALSFIYALPQKKKCIFIYTAIFFAFALRYAYQTESHLRIQKKLATKDHVVGTITDVEQIFHSPQFKERITIAIHSSGAVLPWYMHIYTHKKNKLMPGDTIAASNITWPPIKQSEFDMFLRKEWIAATLFLSKKNKLSLLSRPQQSMHREIWQKRTSMLNAFNKNLPADVYQLTSCIFWGNRTVIKQSPSLKTNFKKCGISHYLARSGLHLILFIYMLQQLLRLLPLLFFYKTILTLLCGIMYHILTWPSISFYRAFALFFLCCISTVCLRRTHFLYLLSLVCITLLALNPTSLFFLDFQLTFALTYALSWHNFVTKSKKHLS